MNQLFGLQHRGVRHLGMGACFHASIHAGPGTMCFGPSFQSLL